MLPGCSQLFIAFLSSFKNKKLNFINPYIFNNTKS